MRSGAGEQLQAMFSDIHGSGRRMLALVNDLLDASKLDAVGALEVRAEELARAGRRGDAWCSRRSPRSAS